MAADDIAKKLNSILKTVNKLAVEVVSINDKLGNLVTRAEFSNKSDNVMTKMDSVYKEVINMRDEQSAHFLKT